MVNLQDHTSRGKPVINHTEVKPIRTCWVYVISFACVYGGEVCMLALQLGDPKGTFDGNGRQAISDKQVFLAIYRFYGYLQLFVAIFRICLKICNLIMVKGLDSFSNPG